MRAYFFIFFLILSFSSCSPGGPSCVSDDVQSLVLEILKEQYHKEIAAYYFQENWDPSSMYQYADANNIPYVKGFADPDVQEKILTAMSNDLEVQSQPYADSIVAVTDFKLTAIRTEKIFEDIVKCECAAQLLISNDPVNIVYTAQDTEDGDIYVEVNY